MAYRVYGLPYLIECVIDKQSVLKPNAWTTLVYGMGVPPKAAIALHASSVYGLAGARAGYRQG